MVKTKSCCSKTTEKVKSIDMFASPAVQLNFAGAKEVPTWPGWLISVFVYLIVILYAYSMGIECFTRAKPKITKTKFEPEDFDEFTSVDLEELGFKIAFGVIDSDTMQDLSNSQYVEWDIYISETVNFIK